MEPLELESPPRAQNPGPCNHPVELHGDVFPRYVSSSSGNNRTPTSVKMPRRIPATCEGREGYVLITTKYLCFKGNQDASIGIWAWEEFDEISSLDHSMILKITKSASSENSSKELSFHFEDNLTMQTSKEDIELYITAVRGDIEQANKAKGLSTGETLKLTHHMKAIPDHDSGNGSRTISSSATSVASNSIANNQEFSTAQHELLISQLQKDLEEQKENIQRLSASLLHTTQIHQEEMKEQKEIIKGLQLQTSKEKIRAAMRDLMDQEQPLGEFEGLIRTNGEAMEEVHVPFGESAYTLLFMYGFGTQTFWFGFLVCAIQAGTICLTIFDAVNRESEDNKLQIPPMVGITVTIIQATALFVLIPYIDDLIDAVVKLQDGPYHDTIKGGYRYQDQDGYHDQPALPGASFAGWLFSCLSQLLVGILLMLGSFILTMQAGSVVEVMLNLTALLFITQMDDLGFMMAARGFVTNKLQKDVEDVVDYKLPKRRLKTGYVFRRVLYFISLVALYIGYGVVKSRQLNGYFLPTYLYVQLGDAYRNEIGFYSGLYKAEQQRNLGYRRYRDMMTGKVLLSFCEGENAWTFSDQNDSCKYFAKSPVESAMTSYDVSSIPTSEWAVVDDSTNRLRPFDSFTLVNQDCSDETCQGKCVQKFCLCPNDRFGISCEFGADSVCETITISDESDPFPDWKIQNSSAFDYAAKKEIAISDTYHMLRNAQGAVVKFHTMPVYYSNETYPANIIFFEGLRWILTSEFELLGQQFFSEQSKRDEESFVPYFAGETIKRFNGKFEARDYAVCYYSSEMGFQTPDFQATPIGLSWWAVDTERAFRVSTQSTVQLSCQASNCKDVDNYCGRKGSCNADTGICTCAPGFYGSRCTYQGECDQCNVYEVCDASGKCRCPTPFYGENCAETYECWEEGGKCRNGGLCNANGFCDCPDDPAISDFRCSTIASCAAYGCQNGGVCAPNGKCICRPPYHGTHCHLLDESQEHFWCSRDVDCQSLDPSASCDLETGMCDCNDPAAFGTLCQHKYNCTTVEQIHLNSHLVIWLSQGGMERLDDDDGFFNEDGSINHGHVDFELSCLNSGTCNQFSGLCLCPEGYFGPDCSQIEPEARCLTDDDCGTDWYSKCDTNGQCLEFGKLPPKPDGCNKDSDCYNGGICDLKKHKCMCPRAFSGGKCEYITVGDYPPLWDHFETILEGCYHDHLTCEEAALSNLPLFDDDYY